MLGPGRDPRSNIGSEQLMAPLLLSELESVIEELKNDKAAGTDEIPRGFNSPAAAFSFLLQKPVFSRHSTLA